MSCAGSAGNDTNHQTLDYGGKCRSQSKNVNSYLIHSLRYKSPNYNLRLRRQLGWNLQNGMDYRRFTAFRQPIHTTLCGILVDGLELSGLKLS